MHTTIGILAHVDAGKTTFAEQLLYHTGSIRQRGRVDHQDAFLDSHELEKMRGITIFSDQAVITDEGASYTLIDTPGHVDFSPEMERAVQVMDCALVIVSAVEGVEGHTETVWQLLRKHRVPTFFFLNKTDRPETEPGKTLEEIRRNLTPDACDLSASFRQGIVSEELAAFLAERDEALLERYVAGEADPRFWLESLQAMVGQCRVFPCLHGSALHGTGIAECWDALRRLAVCAYSEAPPFAGRVYKIRHDASGTRITFIKALQGSLKVRDEIRYRLGDGTAAEKATQLRIYNGSKYESVDRVTAGQLFAVAGLSAAAAGDGLGASTERAGFELAPALKSKVLFDAAVHAREMLRCFRLLEAEDPSLNVTWDEPLQEIQLHVMGAIQLEVLKHLVQERFGYAVDFGRPEILYKETIGGAVSGYGHFEPLGHYAEVHLRLEPGPRGSGLVFENACHPDDLATGYQHAVRQHLFEREHHGLLTGSPLTDLRITLLTGRAHVKHTSGGDFREAAYRALRQGLEKAENMLLEPWYDLKIQVEPVHLGRVMSDIQQAHGRFDPPDTSAGGAVITGTVPVSTFMHYSMELASFTQGKGAIRLASRGYDRCHNEAEVIAAKGYRKEADPLYSSASIFCSKGQAYAVPWDEAESHMHAL